MTRSSAAPRRHHPPWAVGAALLWVLLVRTASGQWFSALGGDARSFDFDVPVPVPVDAAWPEGEAEARRSAEQAGEDPDPTSLGGVGLDPFAIEPPEIGRAHV